MSSRDKKKREKKTPYFRRLANRAREAAGLGRILITEPRSFPRSLFNVLKRSARDVWNARGGGLYVVGYLCTLIWLEASMLIGEIVDAASIGAFFSEQIVEFLIRFTTESLRNMLIAFMWPVWVIQLSPPWGIITLVLIFLAFDRFLKQRISDWLFQDERPAAMDKVPT